VALDEFQPMFVRLARLELLSLCDNALTDTTASSLHSWIRFCVFYAFSCLVLFLVSVLCALNHSLSITTEKQAITLRCVFVISMVTRALVCSTRSPSSRLVHAYSCPLTPAGNLVSPHWLTRVLLAVTKQVSHLVSVFVIFVWRSTREITSASTTGCV
jgi:hypothetical protein